MKTNIATIENLKRNDVKQLFENSHNSATSRVIEAFYSLLNMNEEPDKKEFRDKISSGVIYYFANYLNDLNLNNVTSSNVRNAKKNIEGLTQESVGVESKAALALLNWLQKTINELKIEEAPVEETEEVHSINKREEAPIDEAKEESKLSEVQNWTNIEIAVHHEPGHVRSPSSSCTWESLNFTWPRKEVNESLGDYIERNSRNWDFVNKADINELSSFRAPPWMIANVVSAWTLILGEKDQSWNGFIKNKYNFLERIKNLDINLITPKTCKKVQKMLEGISEEDVSSKSKACLSLYQFIVAVIQRRIALGLYGDLEIDRKCMTSSVPRRKKAKKSPK